MPVLCFPLSGCVWGGEGRRENLEEEGKVVS